MKWNLLSEVTEDGRHSSVSARLGGSFLAEYSTIAGVSRMALVVERSALKLGQTNWDMVRTSRDFSSQPLRKGQGGSALGIHSHGHWGVPNY